MELRREYKNHIFTRISTLCLQLLVLMNVVVFKSVPIILVTA